MAPDSTRKEVTDLVLNLQQFGLAMAANIHKVSPLGNNRVRVAWANWEHQGSLYDFSDGGFDQYLSALRGQHYSVVLNDGSLLQLSYDFERNDLVYHRLAFLPSPVLFTVDELDDLTIDDFITLCTRDDLIERTRTRPFLRFDYDAKCPEHEPYSHIHTSFAESRLPVCGPISVTQFVEFIFGTFYSDIWKQQEWLRNAPVESLPHNIREEHRRQLHMTVLHDIPRAS